MQTGAQSWRLSNAHFALLDGMDAFNSDLGGSMEERMRVFAGFERFLSEQALEAVNVTGYLFCCRYAIPHIAAGGGGAIVNLASGSGMLGDSARIAYGTSKAAIISMTRYMATQHGAQKIRCNAIAPGPIVTPHSRKVAGKEFDIIARHMPMGELGEPADIAALVAFLGSAESRYINGQVIVIDGGMSAHHAHVMDMMDHAAAQQG